MTETEKKLVKEYLHEMVEKWIPEVVETEMARLPAEYAGLLNMLYTGMKAGLIAKADAKIEQLVG